MTDLRIPLEAVDAVKWFIGTRGLRVRWWKPSEDSLPSVQGSKRGISIIDGFLSGWLTAVRSQWAERAERAERMVHDGREADSV